MQLFKAESFAELDKWLEVLAEKQQNKKLVETKLLPLASLYGLYCWWSLNDAATSAMASGRDVDPGGGSDGSGGFLSNDYTPDFNRVSQIQDTMQAQETFNS